MLTDEEQQWLTLAAVSGLTDSRIQQLLKQVSLAEAVDLAVNHGEQLRQRLKARKPIQFQPFRVEQSFAWLAQSPSHSIITYSSQYYPTLLKQISDPPSVLFVKGDPTCLLKPTIAVVGSRNASHAGQQITAQICQQLAFSGLQICSGMALGIDGVAHKTALQHQHTTVAVLGTGIDCIYPKRHQSLYRDIINQGCVISEFWPNTQAFAGNFPKRNRIISGMSLGCVVMEAQQKSGSLITARTALEQNREVFAVPGNVLSGNSQGCHQLIKQGAMLIESAQDIIEQIATICAAHLEGLPLRHNIDQSSNTITQQLPFAQVLDSVNYETTPIDVIVEHSEQPIAQVMEQLLELELQGWVVAVPGGYVRQKRS